MLLSLKSDEKGTTANSAFSLCGQFASLENLS